MGIMSRMVRLWKADVHGVMDQLEDKGLLLKQYLREMETSLGYKERQIATLTQRLDRLSAQIGRHHEESGKLEQDLTLALEKERDDIARMLIRRRRTLESASRHIKAQIETLTQEKSRLAETLANQLLQVESLRAKADAYCCRLSDRQVDASTPYGPATAVAPSDEEIELELLKRKETLRKGGAP